tara:strand:- start:59 stop:718 length:660 start_codon:yes stop_codon:yes gene_type:complete
MYYYLSLLLALPLLVTWSYRGGSIPGQQSWGFLGKSRPLTLLGTPLFLMLSMTTVICTTQTLNNIDIGCILLGFLLFFGAQTMGWGRQMDLGKNDRPDDEMGWQIRDMFFTEKSSYWRDLTGLYMRMSLFLIPAIAWGYVELWMTLPCIVLFLCSPIIWVLEDKWFYKKGINPVDVAPFGGKIGHSWTEFYIGLTLLLSTVVASSAIYTGFNMTNIFIN